MSITQATLQLQKRVSVVTTTTSSGETITIPSSSQAGDLCIIVNQDGNLGNTGAVTPSGFTNNVNVLGTDGLFTQRLMISHKILASGDPGRNVTGMNSFNPRAACLVFRPSNFTLGSVTTSTPSQQGTSGTPASQTLVLTPASSPRPLIALLAFSGSSGVSGTSISGGPSYTRITYTNGQVDYGVLQDNETATNTTLSMPDRGNNCIASLWFNLK